MCFISQEPRNNFQTCFFLPKTEIHMKILNTEPFLCYLRGLTNLKNKMEFRNRPIHINNELKWFLQHQSCLEAQTGPETNERPIRTTLGPAGPLRIWPGQSGGSGGISRPL